MTLNLPLNSCSKIHPREVREASVVSLNGSLESAWAKIGAVTNLLFSSVKAFCASSVHTKVLLSFLVRAFRGLAIFAKSLMNFL